jgi:signal transduction histidine kinase/CheY-like chemotaxis protein
MTDIHRINTAEDYNDHGQNYFMQQTSFNLNTDLQTEKDWDPNTAPKYSTPGFNDLLNPTDLQPNLQDYAIKYVIEGPTGAIESAIELFYLTDKKQSTAIYTPPQRRSIQAEQLLKQLDRFIKLMDADDKSESALNPELISSLSHRIKTPLTGVISGIQLMYNYEHIEQVSRLLDYIMHSAVELTKFVNDITDYYYISQDIMELDIEPINLNALIQEVYDIYRNQMEEETISFSYHLRPNTAKTHRDNSMEGYPYPPWNDKSVPHGMPKYCWNEDQPQFIINTDRKRLSQVIVNLISNAINVFPFNSPMKRIHLTCEYITIKRCRLIIQDTGPGVNLATAESLFDPFKSNDLGLGLIISRLILSKLGDGTICFIKPEYPYTTAIAIEFGTVESETPVHDYTTKSRLGDFRSSIGVYHQDTVNRDYCSAPHDISLNRVYNPVANREHPTIIIIDDNEANLYMLKLLIDDLLKNIGIVNNIKAFSNSAEGLKYVLENLELVGPIFLDIRMPGLSGIEFIRHYERYSMKKTKIVILSALPRLSILRDLDSVGCGQLDYVSIFNKPYNMEEIKSFLINNYRVLSGCVDTQERLQSQCTTDKSHLIVHPEGVRLGDFSSSLGMCNTPGLDKSTPHGTDKSQLGDFRSSIGVYPQVSINRDFSSSLGMCNTPGLDKSAPHGTSVGVNNQKVKESIV